MQEQKYPELEARATNEMLTSAEKTDAIKRLMAQAVIHGEIQKMRDEGKALTLTDEEFSMIESFRRFKLRMTRNGEVFTWQTFKPSGVELAQETHNK